MPLVLQPVTANEDLGARASALVEAQMAAAAHPEHEMAFGMMEGVPKCYKRFREGTEKGVVVRDGQRVVALAILATVEYRYPCAGFICLIGTGLSKEIRLGIISRIMAWLKIGSRDGQVGLGIPRLCRFEGDRAMLEGLGFHVDTWHWLRMDLKGAEFSAVEASGITVSSWTESLVPWASQLDIEGRLILADREFDPGWSLVLHESGEPKGFILGRLASITELLTDYLFVVEPCRRRGFAQCLKTALLQRAKQRGVGYALTIINSANRASAELNRKMGYQPIAESGIIGVYKTDQQREQTKAMEQMA